MNVKQVIVVRKDLKMQRGKEIAQGSHASMAFMSRRLQKGEDGVYQDGTLLLEGFFSAVELEWISNGRFTKVTLQVNSDEELQQLYLQAQVAGLEVHMIEDSGQTVFHGQPTRTCLAIGPDLAERIDPVTKHLKLY